MATLDKSASSNTVVTTGWTNPTNGYTDDTSYATAVPAKNTTVNSDYGFTDFASGEIPDGSAINSVTMSILSFNSSTTTNKTHGVQGRNNGANSGTEATATGNTAEATITTTLGTVTLADLRSASTLLKARVRSTQGSSSTTTTSSLDRVYVTVDYTPDNDLTVALDGSGLDASYLTGTIAVSKAEGGGSSGVSVVFIGSGL